MKFIKQSFFFLCSLILLLSLAACGEESKITASKPLKDIYADAIAEVTLPELMELDETELYTFTGIPAESYTEGVALIPSDAVSGDMFFLFHAADGASLKTLKTKLEDFRTQKLNEMNNYLPLEYEKINASSVTEKGDYVWLVVADDSAKMNGIIDSSIS